MHSPAEDNHYKSFGAQGLFKDFNGLQSGGHPSDYYKGHHHQPTTPRNDVIEDSYNKVHPPQSTANSDMGHTTGQVDQNSANNHVDTVQVNNTVKDDFLIPPVVDSSDIDSIQLVERYPDYKLQLPKIEEKEEFEEVKEPPLDDFNQLEHLEVKCEVVLSDEEEFNVGFDAASTASLLSANTEELLKYEEEPRARECKREVLLFFLSLLLHNLFGHKVG